MRRGSSKVKFPMLPPWAVRGFFRFKLRWRWIQLAPSRDFAPPTSDEPEVAAVFRDARSGSLAHLSFDRMNVFVKKYFLLWMYLEMALAQLWQPQKRAHSSAHSPRPWSLRLGLAPAWSTEESTENVSFVDHHTWPTSQARAFSTGWQVSPFILFIGRKVV